MFTAIHPKLPMRDKTVRRNFYMHQLGFREFGNADYSGYLMMEKDNIQIHFFEFKALDPFLLSPFIISIFLKKRICA